MTDTTRTQAALLALGTEGVANSWSYQDQRDFIVSAIPSWWTYVHTAGSERVTFGGRVDIFPTDQTDTPGEGMLTFHTTDDLVNQSNLGVYALARVKSADQVGSLIQDYVWMLTVQGLFINAAVEEGGATISLKARGVNARMELDNTGFSLRGQANRYHTISSSGIGFFGAADVNPVLQQTLAASPTVEAIRALLVAYGLCAA